ncbi:hypothetical protein PCE1_004643 [Barthelona sp. PCE]
MFIEALLVAGSVIVIFLSLIGHFFKLKVEDLEQCDVFDSKVFLYEPVSRVPELPDIIIPENVPAVPCIFHIDHFKSKIEDRTYACGYLVDEADVDSISGYFEHIEIVPFECYHIRAPAKMFTLAKLRRRAKVLLYKARLNATIFELRYDTEIHYYGNAEANIQLLNFANTLRKSLEE